MAEPTQVGEIVGYIAFSLAFAIPSIALTLICGTCIYFDLIPGLLVTGACAAWVGMVLKRKN